MANWKLIGGIAGGVIAVAIIGSTVNGNSNTSTNTNTSTASNAKNNTPAANTKSQADAFKACITKAGTDGEKAAVRHVTKVTGADDQNNVLDAPEVFTDLTGGIAGPHQGEGKLIASAFASCYKSDNGLVTVYGADGDLLANGKF